MIYKNLPKREKFFAATPWLAYHRLRGNASVGENLCRAEA
jgi:hypothetical protein